MTSLARQGPSLRLSLRGAVPFASTSKQGFATCSRCNAEDQAPTSQTASTQEALTSTTPAVVEGETNRSGRGGRQGGGGRSGAVPPYSEWIKRDGKMYEEAPPGRGPFWLDATPFPLNKSFDPPPPIAHKQKQQLWHLHLSNSENTVRQLSGRFGISMDRVHAILRLQALEAEWVKDGKPLQTSFQKNMERLLGAIERAAEEGKAEDEVAAEGITTVPRAPNFEEKPLRSDGEEEGSIVAAALKREFKERADRRRTLPTGGPAARGPRPTVQNIAGPKDRASMTIVDMSQRPTSYSGGGVLARNEKRAKKRQEYKLHKQRRAEKEKAATAAAS